MGFLIVIGKLHNCCCSTAVPLTGLLCRNEVKPLTDKVSGALYKGFATCDEAECAYIIAYGLGIVQVLGGDSSVSPTSTS